MRQTSTRVGHIQARASKAPIMSAIILSFTRHGLALSGIGASKASKGSRPRDQRMMGSCHLYGTTPRSRHFSKAFCDTPNSRAASDRSCQSNVVFFMGTQYPYKKSDVKRLLAGGNKSLKCLGSGMTKGEDDDELAIRERIKPALRGYRASRGWSQREMANFLGVPLKNYESYESKPDRGVPAGVISRFCRYTDTDIGWIMLGKKPIRQAG